METECAIIGAGGIGSHFCRMLHRLLKAQQLGTNTVDNFLVYDFDVVEPKNVRWQDYGMDEIGVPKAMLMTLRYGFPSQVKRFDEIDLASHTRYYIAADNARVRSIVFNHFKEKFVKQEKTFVDMRAEGDVYAVFTSECPTKTLLESLGQDQDNETGVSCQRLTDQERNVIQMGNWFAAVAGMDAALRQFRGVPCPASLVRTIL